MLQNLWGQTSTAKTIFLLTAFAMAMSMSSEKRFPILWAFDNEVPPLNIRCSAIGNENTICKIVVTQISFSMACTGKLMRNAVCSMICLCSDFDNIK